MIKLPSKEKIRVTSWLIPDPAAPILAVRLAKAGAMLNVFLCLAEEVSQYLLDGLSHSFPCKCLGITLIVK